VSNTGASMDESENKSEPPGIRKPAAATCVDSTRSRKLHQTKDLDTSVRGGGSKLVAVWSSLVRASSNAPFIYSRDRRTLGLGVPGLSPSSAPCEKDVWS